MSSLSFSYSAIPIKFPAHSQFVYEGSNKCYNLNDASYKLYVVVADRRKSPKGSECSCRTVQSYVHATP
ncbi:unnamed protein product [Auanema sp. JU1783]|nr:unnamed protein product [Auanema sp. JU1783]